MHNIYMCSINLYYALHGLITEFISFYMYILLAMVIQLIRISTNYNCVKVLVIPFILSRKH